VNDEFQGERKQVRLSERSRTVKQRPVTFRCGWCGQLVTELRYPGPTPTYGLACKTEATRHAEAAKKARQRSAPPPQRRRTTTCWDSPTNLLTYGYIDPKVADSSEELRRIRAAIDARKIERADETIRRFLDECGI
jgi:hypothetical protein